MEPLVQRRLGGSGPCETPVFEAGSCGKCKRGAEQSPVQAGRLAGWQAGRLAASSKQQQQKLRPHIALTSISLPAQLQTPSRAQQGRRVAVAAVPVRVFVGMDRWRGRPVVSFPRWLSFIAAAYPYLKLLLFKVCSSDSITRQIPGNQAGFTG